ncbi:MAG: hypothetical protein NVSMB17_02310 [Candidatus Dormibacteria bacterium]
MSSPGLPRKLNAPVVRAEVTRSPGESTSSAIARLPEFELQVGLVRLVVAFGLCARAIAIAEHRALLLALGALLLVFSISAVYEFVTGQTDTDPALVTAVLFTTDALVAGASASLLGVPGAVALAAGLVVVGAAPSRHVRRGAMGSGALFAAAYFITGAAVLVHGGKSEEIAPTITQSAILAVALVAAAAFVQRQSDTARKLAADRRRLHAELSEVVSDDAHERYQSERLLESVSDGVVTIDTEGRIVGANAGAARLLARRTESLLGSEITGLIEDGDADAFAYFLWTNLRSATDDAYFSRAHETRLRRPNGDIVTVELRVGELMRGSERLFACDLRDISEQRARMEVLEYRAMHDPLTALPNRALFTDRLKNAISMAARQGGVVRLLLLDLDGFKEINDSMGHGCGDQLLRQVTDRLLTCVREYDTVARLGGDEFAVIAPDLAEMGSTEILVERLGAAFQTPFMLEGRVVRISASIGIALFPEHATEDVALLRQADVAMYVAKADRSGFFIYSPDRDEHSAQRMMRLAELSNAIIRDELVCFYQPKVDIATREVVGAECLVRWQHPINGLIFPDEFIPIVEGTELMWPLTERILRKALQQSRKWQEEGVDMAVSVNLSAGSLTDRDVGHKIGALLTEVGVPPETLIVEITESSLMAEGASPALAGIRATGAGLSADDFGTGFSSLSALKAMPLTELKIDKSFVLRMDQEANDAAIVGPIVELGRKRGLKVVAEGVENAEIFQMLSEFSCDLAQGYYIAKPMPGWEFETWLRTSKWRPRRRSATSRELPTPGIQVASPAPLPTGEPTTAPAAVTTPVLEPNATLELTPHDKALVHLFEPPPIPARARRGRRPARSAPSAPPARPARKPTPDALQATARRQRALKRGLDAVITFVDAAPRQSHAATCAAVLARAVPRADRGEALTGFLDAARRGERPGRLQSMAEDAGVELALAIKQLTIELRAAA